jgi:hypothetical protein
MRPADPLPVHFFQVAPDGGFAHFEDPAQLRYGHLTVLFHQFAYLKKSLTF